MQLASTLLSPPLRLLLSTEEFGCGWYSNKFVLIEVGK